MTQAIGYIRRSTDKQEESLDQQRAKLEAFATAIRGKVEEDKVNGVPDTTTEDMFNGPLLGPVDASDEKTAEWWHDIEVIYQVKVDTVQPILSTSGRKPASN